MSDHISALGTRVTAPGKAILCGEYAVLYGAPAVSTAVDRCVRAEIGSGGDSPFLRAAQAHAKKHVQALGGAWNDRNIKVDSTALYEDAHKIGLGSSAAVTVAAVGTLLADAGVALDDRKAIFDVAQAAHSEAQGSRGSGIDVATSVWGGTIRFARQAGAIEVEELLLPSELDLTFVFTGKSASTADRIARIEKLAAEQPRQFDDLIDGMTEMAKGFVLAFETNDVSMIVPVVNGYYAAMLALGKMADIEIVTAEHQLLSELARKHGGAAKPSGAGGGDLGVAFTIGAERTAAFRAELSSTNLIPLTIRASAPGLRLERS